MAFSIRNARVEQKARAYAAETGSTLTGALERALDAALAEDRVGKEQAFEAWVAPIRELQKQMAALPVLDPRTPDEILYDRDGIPH